MKKRTGKPVKWHMSFGPGNPRINLEKLDVVNHVFNKENINKQITLRIETQDLREHSIIISDKEFALIKKDILTQSPVKDLKYAGVFLYGQGVMVAEFITHEIEKFRQGFVDEADKLKKQKDEEV